MNITLIGTYPPRKCGIATFTKNLADALNVNINSKVNIVALNDNENTYKYTDEIIFTIDQENQQDYTKAADILNNSDTDVCILQHEYGIFGGSNGIYVLSLLNYLKLPVIVTVHTVLKQPSFLQKIIMQQVARKAHKLVVMSKLAVSFLETVYEISPDKILIIEHGVPDVENNSPRIERELQQFADKKMLFTFGLLSKNKGIETVIRALPSVINKYPDVIYVVVGNTHPSVIKYHGEEYREYLINLSEKLGIRNNVYFIDHFVTDEELLTYLRHTYIYITPYLNEEQITSGTLSYAIGAGAASISTPYWHAKELLDNGRGELFPFKNSEALSSLLDELLNDPCKLKTIRKNALLYAQYIKWPSIGLRYREVAQSIIKQPGKYQNNNSFELSTLPAFSLEHIKRLTDDTGIVQHAKYGIPNLKEGYCLDDNARALILMLMASEHRATKDIKDLLPVYVSYIHYMQREDGWFRNFLHFNRNYLDDIGSEDSFGRTIWALCYMMYNAPGNSYREFAHDLFGNSFPVMQKLQHLRGIANTLIGLCYYMRTFPTDEGMLALVKNFTERLTDAFNKHATEDWCWFEDKLTYDNGILPLALLHSYEITGDARSKKTALHAIKFLKKKTFNKEYFTPVGNKGFYQRDDANIPMFDQQAIEVMAMVLLFQQAYIVTKDSSFLHDMNTCFMWFMGKNELHIPLYDPETHGCSDGLEFNSINRNQGAESTLAYLISYLAVVKTNEKEPDNQNHNGHIVRVKDLVKIKNILPT